jgi:hypothetical protein
LAKLQSKIHEDPQNFDNSSKGQSSCSSSIPGAEELRTHVSGFMNISGASNKS